MTETIRDQRKVPFAQVESPLLRDPNITPQCKALYSLLITYGPDRIFPGHKRLAEEIGATRQTVIRWLQELRDIGLIDWVRRTGTSNMYSILGYENYKWRCNTDVAGDVTPVLQGMSHGHDTGCNASVTRSISTEVDPPTQVAEKPKTDHLDLASHTHAIREQRKAEGKAPSFSEGDGVSENLFHSAPLVAFCRLLPCDPADLPADKCASWERELRTLATDNETTPAELAAALAGLKADGSAYAWKTYSTPFSDGFQGDVTAVLAIRRGEARAGKIPGNGRGPPQPTGPPIVITGLDETPEWLRG